MWGGFVAWWSDLHGPPHDFHAVIGQEAEEQCAEEAFGSLPDVSLACVVGDSSAMGLSHGCVDDPAVRLTHHGSRGIV